MKTITELCHSHRRKSYFDDGEGLVGVYNHANKIQWYRFIPQAGYSLVGSTDTPLGAVLRKLTDDPPEINIPGGVRPKFTRLTIVTQTKNSAHPGCIVYDESFNSVMKLTQDQVRRLVLDGVLREPLGSPAFNGSVKQYLKNQLKSMVEDEDRESDDRAEETGMEFSR